MTLSTLNCHAGLAHNLNYCISLTCLSDVELSEEVRTEVTAESNQSHKDITQKNESRNITVMYRKTTGNIDREKSM